MTQTQKRHLNVGTIGHVDHGKTTLTAAISATMGALHGGRVHAFEDIDRAPEEKRRGITIVASHVRYESASRVYAHIDCPGHADFVKNMIVGASQMDATILLVDGSQGCEAQTREHVLLARQLGVEHLVVFVNKADVADPELLELVELEVHSLLEQHAYEDVPVVVGSALRALEAVRRGDLDDEWVQRIRGLVETLDTHVPDPDRDREGPFLMPVEGVCSIKGLGTVVTGCVERGVLRVGDAIELVGRRAPRAPVVVKGIQAFHAEVPAAEAGLNVGLLLRGVGKDDVERGQVAVTPGSVQPHALARAEIFLLEAADGGRHTAIRGGYMPQIWFGATDVTASFGIEGELVPGARAEVDLTLQRAVAMEAGMRFAIREGSRTVGAGIVTAVW